ncbi:hypothetical protein ACFOY4_01355 [Actinomadura syzygii]|uniref:Uncharacterized protein n=1 Tax=Actinomadura syzygii TaxID=1427538 RepID=A0A5D0TS55_9ACTN|nr:hypothetical protein [Actinomadura syzygii]TYC08604.1 hypothetical protein FXF65_37560 [Actinomadura syzygii]
MRGRVYLDPGDKRAGPKIPPEPVTVLTRWATLRERGSAPVWPWLQWTTPPRAGGPQNVHVRRTCGQEEVVPTRAGLSWRLRIPYEPTDLGAVAAAYGGSVHRCCDWPSCPALMDAVAVMSGEPGAPSGWMRGTMLDLRMCPDHVDVWNDHAHVPAWTAVGVDRTMACSCGTPLPGRAVGDITDTYCAHLAEMGES